MAAAFAIIAMAADITTARADWSDWFQSKEWKDDFDTAVDRCMTGFAAGTHSQPNDVTRDLCEKRAHRTMESWKPKAVHQAECEKALKDWPKRLAAQKKKAEEEWAKLCQSPSSDGFVCSTFSGPAFSPQTQPPECFY